VAKADDGSTSMPQTGSFIMSLLLVAMSAN
jgi:hypothetical protein